jgi:hypothetical protein
VPTTITLDGTTVVSTLPGITSIQTTTITIDAETQTITGPGVTVTINEAATCPAPTNSAPVTPQDSGPDALWGCSPGFVCNVPKPAGCKLWADPPKYDYLCDAKYCISSPPFSPVVWPVDKPSYYPPTPGYFNLNPKAFGLDYGIFVKKVIVTYTIKYGSKVLSTYTTGKWASQTALTHFPPGPTPKLKARKYQTLQKRDSSIVPAVCFAQCNNCYIEAQRVGKSPALCDAESAFQTSYESCRSCVEANGDTTKVSLQTYVDPQFAPFVNFCQAQSAEPELDSPSTTTSTQTVVPVPVTQSVVVTTETAPTPTETVDVTTQAPANTNTDPVPISSTTPSVTSGAGNGTATTSGPIQVTGAANNLHPASFTLLASILGCSLLALFL